MATRFFTADELGFTADYWPDLLETPDGNFEMFQVKRNNVGKIFAGRYKQVGGPDFVEVHGKDLPDEVLQ
jgi:hypothetical protein